MPSAHLTLREEDVVRLTLDFLHSRDLHISQLSLERETGVINGNYSDDVLFLRQLILDGQWDDVLEFIQPLEALPTFDARRFRYAVLRHKYVELLCIKSEALLATSPTAAPTSVDSAVEDVVKVLNELERVAPSKEDYSNLCLLLTLPRLSDHLQYKDWNPSNARVQCFREVYPLVEQFLPCIKKTAAGIVEPTPTAKNDRLIHLIIKGILYESCVNYCQAKATGNKESQQQEMTFSRLLDGSVGYSDSDLSLLSWLQSIPADTFSVPFEQRTLNVDIVRLERPSLETSWTEHMLVTPIKPKQFPHSAMPFTRPRSAADIMSRSLLPALDGLPHGLQQQQQQNHQQQQGAGVGPHRAGTGLANPVVMALSTGDILSGHHAMSRSSFASFHLTGYKNNKLMNTSVDRLFENDGDVFLSTSYSEFQPPSPAGASTAKRPVRGQSRSPDRKAGGGALSSAASTPEHRGRDSPATASSTATTARSSRRDSLSDRCSVGPPQPQPPPQLPAVHPVAVVEPQPNANFEGDLYREFQRQKQRINDTLQAKERERDELVRQIAAADNRLSEVSGGSASGGVVTGKPPVGGRPAAPAAATVVVRANAPPSATSRVAVNGSLPHHEVNRDHPPAPLSYHAGNCAVDLSDGHYDTVKQPATAVGDGDLNGSVGSGGGPGRPRFVAVTTLEDVQAVRCAEFHPQGRLYAVGSNSKTLRICSYPKLSDLREDHATYQPTVLFKRTKHHKGSIYCLAWTPIGDLMATGSNDKTLKLMRFNADTSNLEGQEIELTMHDGTVRDLCFLEDTTNKSSLLISGGAGDCKIYVTDCATGTSFLALSGHSGHVLTLYNWGGAMFVSGSQDKTVRFWDLRTRGCVNMVTPATAPGNRGSPVTAVCVDPSGRLLVSGHEDSSCVLYDIRGGRNVQCFKPHSAEVRSIRFSPSAYYLLTGGYDNKLVLTDLQGDLTLPLPSVVVAQHQDKVISGRWHPTEFSFLSTSADKTATLWALPPV
ncbi:WD repeat-containing protein 47 [Schistocerca nitens]|uniref:WD repeat-containing protein 47 n=1 Tax=Schistocerca nitens TaxID=7011 RepID=UPI00211739AE|nr:WD repeat-containing protein 47 [Schistocerca nitens]